MTLMDWCALVPSSLEKGDVRMYMPWPSKSSVVYQLWVAMGHSVSALACCPDIEMPDRGTALSQPRLVIALTPGIRALCPVSQPPYPGIL